MSGENRISVGEITQSTIKGSALKSALASALEKETPREVPKEGKQKKNE